MSIIQQLALTHGYEKSALLPYPCQAHHKPPKRYGEDTLLVRTPNTFRSFARFSFFEVVIRQGI